jgi:hypothetical protein
LEELRWRRMDVKDKVRQTIKTVKEIHSQYWDCFRK